MNTGHGNCDLVCVGDLDSSKTSKALTSRRESRQGCWPFLFPGTKGVLFLQRRLEWARIDGRFSTVEPLRLTSREAVGRSCPANEHGPASTAR